MFKKTFSHKLWLVAVLCSALAIPSTDAFAARDRDRGRSHEFVRVGHDRYHYHDGRFFRPSWFGFEIALVSSPIGAVVTFLPSGYTTLVVGGVKYYHYNNIYYKASPAGYVVVPDPAYAGSQPITGETVTINVPNSNGSFTQVTLVRRNNGYVGPQGEYYAGNPTVEQLKTLYAR